MKALIATFIVIAAAELGDKTQLLTFGFATRYPLWEVISAVFCASALLMAIAVFLGDMLSHYLPQFYVSLAAGLFFIAFGLNMIFGSGEKEEKSSGGTGNPFWVVFSGFLIAELGDKTQIATLALSAEYALPFMVWIGATLGMTLINLLGAVAGRVVGKFVSTKALQLFGAAVFIIFGLVTLGDLFIW